MDDFANTDFSSLITGSWIATVVSILLGIACIVACVYLAKRKGHDTAKAFTSGCVFGIFGVIYYLVVGESKKKLLEDSLAQSPQSQLPEPAAMAPPTPAPPSVPAPPLPPVRCQYCGNVNPGEAQWCLGCGMNLDFDPTVTVALDKTALQRAAASRTKWIVLTVLGLAVLIAAAVFVIAKS